MPPGEKSIINDPLLNLSFSSLIETTDSKPLSNKFVRLRSVASVTDTPTVNTVGFELDTSS